MDQEKVGNFIRECRLKKNLSQTDLANKLGITNKAVSKWENGRCMPDISLLEPLSEILEVSINEIIKGEKITKIDKEVADENIRRALSYYESAKRRRFIFKVVCLFIIVGVFKLIVIGSALLYSVLSAKVIEVNDIKEYQQVIGDQAREEYKSKWGMREEILPSNLKGLNVQDFKFVYYNPWDAQYLSYLVIDYETSEIDRLKKLGIDNYIGNYGVTGFNEKYELLAMEVDDTYGFIYAITDGENIIYVELVFANYFYDIEYKNYINNEYLPLGFDATIDNDYQKKMMGE